MEAKRDYTYPMTPTWYEQADPSSPPRFPSLDGDRRVTVCVIGAGLTGLGAAISLAERGVDVLVLEKGRVAGGASGRSGGQVHSGQRRDQLWLERHMGIQDARRLWLLAEDAKRHLHELRERYIIPCDWTPGLILADHKPSYVAGSRAYVEHLHRQYQYLPIDYFDREELYTLVRSPNYYGGQYDAGGGHLNPLKLTLGLARAAAGLGVDIREGSEAKRIEATGASAIVETDVGRVEADWVIVAGDALMDGLDTGVDSHILPIASTVAVTNPLPYPEDFLNTDAAVADSRFVVNYFQKTQDGRLLFGGGESYSTRPVAHPARLVRRALAGVFPELAHVYLEYAWSGLVGVTRTRLPYVRRHGAHVLIAAGYSGHGVALAPYFGHLLAEVTAGALERFDLLGSLPVPAFPGGAWLRRPLLAAAMSYYALRDRIL